MSPNRLAGSVIGYVKKTYSEAAAIPATINSKHIAPIWDARSLAPDIEFGAAFVEGHGGTHLVELKRAQRKKRGFGTRKEARETKQDNKNDQLDPECRIHPFPPRSDCTPPHTHAGQDS